MGREAGNALIESVEGLLAQKGVTIEDLQKDSFLLKFFLYRAACANDAHSFRYAKALLDMTYGNRALPSGGNDEDLPEAMRGHLG